jgi:hypothetical protein
VPSGGGVDRAAIRWIDAVRRFFFATVALDGKLMNSEKAKGHAEFRRIGKMRVIVIVNSQSSRHFAGFEK